MPCFYNKIDEKLCGTPVLYSRWQCVRLTSLFVHLTNAVSAKYPVARNGIFGILSEKRKNSSTVAVDIILTNDSKREHVFQIKILMKGVRHHSFTIA